MNTTTKHNPATLRVEHLEKLHRLYPLSVYKCPNGHAPFYSRAGWGQIMWTCPDCNAQGEYIYCAGEGYTWLRDARPVAPPHRDTRIAVKKDEKGYFTLLTGIDLPMNYETLTPEDQERAKQALKQAEDYAGAVTCYK